MVKLENIANLEFIEGKATLFEDGLTKRTFIIRYTNIHIFTGSLFKNMVYEQIGTTMD